jgi:dienelactone hydrolase
MVRGTEDGLVRHPGVQAFADALQAAGQTVEYIQVEDAGHAFFDWKPDSGTKATFAKYGVPYAAKMKSLFDRVFYPQRSPAGNEPKKCDVLTNDRHHVVLAHLLNGGH